jgi:hypothetical protein
MVIRNREITEIGWPYRCPLCDNIVWRDSHKSRYDSYCDKAEKRASMKRLTKKQFVDLLNGKGGPNAT